MVLYTLGAVLIAAAFPLPDKQNESTMGGGSDVCAFFPDRLAPRVKQYRRHYKISLREYIGRPLSPSNLSNPALLPTSVTTAIRIRLQFACHVYVLRDGYFPRSVGTNAAIPLFR